MKGLLKGVLYTWTVLTVIILVTGFVLFTTTGFDDIHRDLKTVTERTEQAHGLAHNANLKTTLDSRISNVLNENRDRIVYIEIALNEKLKKAAGRLGLSQGGSGTGWFVEVNDEFAYVATNHHVVQAAIEQGEIYDVNILEYGSPWSFPAEIVGYDVLSDIAVLKIKKVLGTEKWRTIEWADHDTTEPGDTVVAIGHGMSLPWSMTSGTITALDRWMIRPYNMMIQSDTVVNPGNSGGPLLNLQGQVVGVVDALLDPGMASSGSAAYAGVSLIIAGFQAEKSINEIIEHGKVSYPYVEFGMDNPTREEYTKAFGTSDDGSFVILKEIREGTKAHEAGFKTGDFILSMDSREIVGMISLVKQVLAKRPGDVVEFEVFREGERVKVLYTLEDLAEHQPELFAAS